MVSRYYFVAKFIIRGW